LVKIEEKNHLPIIQAKKSDELSWE